MVWEDAAGRNAGSRLRAFAPPPRHTQANDLSEATLASGPGLPGAARAALFDWLAGSAPAGLVSDAQLLVSELATNSFLHAEHATGEPVRLRAGSFDRSIWVEVADAGRDGAVTRRAPLPDGSGGFGLHLVDHLASDWGVTHVDGTEVWFVLAHPARA